MASLERQTSRVSALKGQFEALSAEGRQNLLKETERVRALFKKYDTDASGTIDAHEFQVLAFDLGLVLTDQEAKNFVQELDTDGNGTVDFAEFLTWWNNPDKKVVGTENQNRLKMLKLRLRSQSALAAASAITNSLAKKVEATKPEAESAEPPQKDQSTFSVKVNIGQFDAPRSSLALTYANAADKAEAIRQVTKAGENALAVTLRLAIKQGVDLFEVGEVSSAIKGVLSLAKKKLKYSDVATKMEKVDGQDVLALSFAFEPAEVELLPELSQLFGALEFSKLEVKAEASERPGDAPSPQGLAVRLSTSLAFNRKAMQALYEQDEHSNRNPIRKGMALANALRNVALVVESENISHFIKKEFNTAKVGEDVNSFATLQSKLIFPALAGILANDELPAVITDLYSSCLKVLSDVHGIQVAIGPHVFEVATSGLHLFDSSYFPSRDDLKKWVVEQEEEKKRRELEKEKALEEKLKRFWEDLDD